jgi:hypothetical protein
LEDEGENGGKVLKWIIEKLIGKLWIVFNCLSLGYNPVYFC